MNRELLLLLNKVEGCAAQSIFNSAKCSNHISAIDDGRVVKIVIVSFLTKKKFWKTDVSIVFTELFYRLWSHLGLNQGLPDYESGALTN